MNIAIVAAEIVKRVPAMAKDSAQNNEELITGIMKANSKGYKKCTLGKGQNSGCGVELRLNIYNAPFIFCPYCGGKIEQ